MKRKQVTSLTVAISAMIQSVTVTSYGEGCSEKPASSYETGCPECIKQVCEIFDPNSNSWVPFPALCIPASKTDKCYADGDPLEFRYTEYPKGATSCGESNPNTCVYGAGVVSTRFEKLKLHGVCPA